MPVLSERAKEELKKPLGKLYKSASELTKAAAGKRVISVGDACTLALVDAGARPHLAVFDFKCMRHDCGADMIARLKGLYPEPAAYDNPAGTLSDALRADAAKLIARGGGVLINGEEDLTALAFIMAAGKDDVVVYGQPGEGMVMAKPGKKLIEKIGGLLTA